MHSRRSVVAGCGAVLASTALSGCGILDSDGGGGSGGGVYTDWSYEADVDLASFSYLQYAELASIDGLLEGFLNDELLGIPIEQFDHRIGFQAYTVVEGSFGASEFRTGYEDEQNVTLEEADERSGYQFYGVSGQPTQIGLRDGSAVLGPSQGMDAFLDAGTGESDSLVGANDDFDALTSELGVNHSVSGSVKLSSDAGSTSMAEAEMATGGATEYGPDVTNFKQVVLFETPDDVDEDSVRSNFEGQDQFSDLSTSVDGRAVTATFTIQTADLG